MKKNTLLCILALALAAGAFTLSVSAANTISKSSEQSVFSFSESDFEDLALYEESGLSGIVIASLPDLSEGILKLGDYDAEVGDTLSLSAISALRFYPNEGVSSASFGFLPVFSGEVSNETHYVNLSLSSGENYPPIAENLSFTTYRGIALQENFRASDPEGEALTYRVISEPKKGSVEISGSGFVYTPQDGKKGVDIFSYVAIDPVGNVSSEADVTVKIEKSKSKITYSDTENSSAAYAALRLAEEDIFVGECLGGEYFFRPEQSISRSEFLAMCLNAAGAEKLSNISKTGFADDSEIPSWAKGYVSAAVIHKVISGYSTDSGIVFDASAPIRFAEASVILNNVLSISNVKNFEESESVPSWAQQATANLISCNVIISGSSVLSSECMTRADAAKMICSALDLFENRSFSMFGK